VGSDYPHSESTFSQSRKILAEILEGVPDDEQAKIASGNTACVYNLNVGRLTVLTDFGVERGPKGDTRTRNLTNVPGSLV
jgi:hypothetical protein